VLSLLLQGKPNKEIARRLGLSVETVKDHVQAVLRALGVNSRTQAVLAVSQLGAKRADRLRSRRCAEPRGVGGAQLGW
jgi:DNA-binding NarL/FixJ family response regulator